MRHYKNMLPITSGKPTIDTIAKNRRLDNDARSLSAIKADPATVKEHAEHVAAIDLHDKINNRLVELFNSKSESDNNKYWNVRKMAYDRPDSPDDLVRMFTEGRL